MIEKALSRQVGGTHYKGMKIEPFTFGLVNHYDPACFSILKYVSRHATKNGVEDLMKAQHIAFIRADEMPTDYRHPARGMIGIETYIDENRIPELEAKILRDNHEWACGRLASLTDHQAAEFIAQGINHLIDKHYRKEPNDNLLR